MDFKNYLKTPLQNRKFICLKTSPLTTKNLRDFCLKNDIDISKDFDGKSIAPTDFMFHYTVFYSSNKPNIILPETVAEIKKFSTYSLGFQILGKENNCLTLNLMKTPKLLSYRNRFEKYYGLEDEWPEHKPHLTLTYNYDNRNIEELILPIFPIEFSILKIEDIKESS